MIRNRDILKSLPLLAAILGDQYGVEVRIGGKDAKTNGKTIYLPSLPMTCDTELLAMARGYLDHEAAHIRHTDFRAIKNAKMDKITFHFFNAIEDWRIERKLGAIFPGCKQNLRWLVRRLFLENRPNEKAGAGNQNPALFVLDYVLFAVRSWDEPALWENLESCGKNVEANFPGLKHALDKILDVVSAHCPDTHTAIVHALKLSACLKQWLPPEHMKKDKVDSEEKAKPASQGEPGEMVNTATNLVGDEHQANKSNTNLGNMPTAPSFNIHAGNQAKIESQGDAHNTEAAIVVKKQADLDAKTRLDSLFSLDRNMLPKNIGEWLGENLANHADNCVDNHVRVAVRGHMPIRELPEKDLQEAMQMSIALRARLCALIQTETQSHSRQSRRGRLDTSSIYRLNVGNPKIFKRESPRKDLDTAIHVLMDTSGSMLGEPIRLAGMACFALAKALENQKGISTGITAFPASLSQSPAVYSILEHGDRVTSRFKVDAMGITPLTEAIWWTMQVLIRRKEARKILIILTDGRPENKATACDALQHARHVGIEPYGIGIMDANITDLLPNQSSVIRKMSELAPAMFDLLGRKLCPGMGGGNDFTC